jgi:hypothetical protein
MTTKAAAVAMAAGFATVLGLAGVSEAAVTFSVINQGVPTNGTLTMTGWTGYVLQLSSNSGNITAVDFSAAKAFAGPMSQRWTSSEGDGTYDTKSPGFLTQVNAPATTSSLNFDSHFLGDSSNFAVAVSPIETNTVPNGNPLTSTPSVGYGVGTSLGASYGVQGAFQSTTLNVAYLVVKDGQSVTFTNAPIATIGGTFQISGSVGAVPEPASMSVAAIAGLGLLARRRNV